MLAKSLSMLSFVISGKAAQKSAQIRSWQMTTAKGWAWLVTLISLLATMLPRPMDGIAWHLFGEHFLRERLWRDGISPCLEAVFLLSLSTALVLTAASYIENRTARKS